MGKKFVELSEKGGKIDIGEIKILFETSTRDVEKMHRIIKNCNKIKIIFLLFKNIL